jgi:hypothetical protein
MNNELVNQALAVIESYKTNAIIMDFVNKEALEKVAADIRAKTNSGTTAKAVSLLMITNKDKTIAKRFNEYVQLGLVGCFMASIKR